MTEEKITTKPATTEPYRKLTVAQKAEAALLWKTGEASLDEIAAKFGKRPEAFSRMFKEMGVVKGSGAKELAERIAAAEKERTTIHLDDTLEKIAKVKEQHLAMSSNIAKMAWQEIARAKEAGLGLETLKDKMLTLKIAGELIANARKEAYSILNVEKHDAKEELDDLPELTVRELSNQEIEQIQATDLGDEMDDSGMGGYDIDDAGADMLPDTGLEGL